MRFKRNGLPSKLIRALVRWPVFYSVAVGRVLTGSSLCGPLDLEFVSLTLAVFAQQCRRLGSY